MIFWTLRWFKKSFAKVIIVDRTINTKYFFVKYFLPWTWNICQIIIFFSIQHDFLHKQFTRYQGKQWALMSLTRNHFSKILTRLYVYIPTFTRLQRIHNFQIFFKSAYYYYYFFIIIISCFYIASSASLEVWRVSTQKTINNMKIRRSL